MSSTAIQGPPPPKPQPARAAEPVIMPTLLGVGYGNYEVQPNNFILSFLVHTIGVFAIVWVTHFLVSHAPAIKQNVMILVSPDDIVLPVGKDKPGGGGGGGEAAKLDASKGKPPKLDMNQITP